MCGIAGCIHPGDASNRHLSGMVEALSDQDLADIVDDMGQAIAHRGPDGAGHHLAVSQDGRWHVAIGHRRLAIIDLAGGVQPMASEDGRAVLVFNGEIYNFAELRRDLETLGYSFRTRSDTEVLLKAYLAWGSDCVARLSGMFAFAIWDHERDRLFLARDRFGKKPLYLWEGGDGSIIFGSEIKALLAHPSVEARLDRTSVKEYLAWRYVPGPHTLFDRIKKLPPASWAMWEEGRITQATYWAPPDGGERPAATVPADPVYAFSRILEDCVARRMVSDVPFGAFLSGGLDSSSVVALMSRHSDMAVNTFSVGYAEAAYSELKYARLVAERFKTRHHELLINADDVIADLPMLTGFRDAPVAEPADMPIYRLSKEAGRSVKMVLTGEGSDELLGGYPKHMAETWAPTYQRMVPSRFHEQVVEPLIRRLPYSFRRAKTVANTVALASAHERFPRWFGAFTEAEVEDLCALDAPPREMDPRPFLGSKLQSPLRRILYFDQTSWLPDNLLERGDRMTMAASIEARMPFMDERLALFLAQLPDRYRVRGLKGKWLLRKAMARALPHEILYRPKVGFRVPVNEWFKGRLKGWVMDLLQSELSMTRTWYRADRLDRIIREHAAGRQNHEKILWTLVTLELFQRHYRLR